MKCDGPPIRGTLCVPLVYFMIKTDCVDLRGKVFESFDVEGRCSDIAQFWIFLTVNIELKIPKIRYEIV